MVLAVGDPVDALFAFVMVFNTGIGILQEVRAKRTLDRLRILVAPTVRSSATARSPGPADRNWSSTTSCSWRPGDQVPVDGRVVASTASRSTSRR